MNIEIVPNLLKKLIINPYIELCPLCCNKLDKNEIEIMESYECRACNLGVFTTNCSCTYQKVKKWKITCKKCNTCKMCGNQMIFYNTDKDECVACNLKKFNDEIEKAKIKMEQPSSNIKKNVANIPLTKEQIARNNLFTKLKLYSLTELRILCRYKKLKNFYKIPKHEVIKILMSVITDKDFEIINKIK